jgi:hypothetical protein
MPWFFIQLRYMKPFLSAVPNHSAERSLGGEVVMAVLRKGSPIKVLLLYKVKPNYSVAMQKSCFIVVLY